MMMFCMMQIQKLSRIFALPAIFPGRRWRATHYKKLEDQLAKQTIERGIKYYPLFVSTGGGAPMFSLATDATTLFKKFLLSDLSKVLLSAIFLENSLLLLSSSSNFSAKRSQVTSERSAAHRQIPSREQKATLFLSYAKFKKGMP
jgi:hypothetical protein